MVRKVKQAIVLAGGKGTRLRPLTNNRPKPLLPVLERPCIEYVLMALDEAGIDEIIIACGYRAHDLVEALGDQTPGGTSISFAFEDEPAGTAGAVKLLEYAIDGTFIVASGDVLADVDMRALIDHHDSKKAFATMALTTVDRPEEFGIVGLDEEGRIERFKEKPPAHQIFSHLINAGIYVLEKGVFQHIPEGQMFDFSKNLFPSMLEKGEALFGAQLTGMWKDIGRPSDLLEANIEMASRKGSYQKAPNLFPPVHIGDNVLLEEQAELSSSVIGSSITGGEGSRIESSLLMDGCRIGERCHLEGCVLGKDCVVGNGSTLTRCALGDGTAIAPGTVVEGSLGDD